MKNIKKIVALIIIFAAQNNFSYAQEVMFFKDTINLEIGVGGNFVSDEKDGKWTYYFNNHTDESIQYTAEFQNGKLHGVLNVFSQDKRKIASIVFKHGLKHGKAEVYGKKRG